MIRVMIRVMVRILVLAMVLWPLSFTAQAQQGMVRSELSASTITRDESVTLTIQAVGIDGELDTSALEKDFEIMGRSSSRQVSTVTGPDNRLTTTSVVTWALELLPRDVGVFTVPAVTVGGIPAQLQTLTVNDLPVGARRDIFVEASVDTQQPWVQSQVVMTVRVFQAIDIVDGGLSDPVGDALEVQRIGEDTRTAEERDGRRYAVTERRFALLPQRSGRLTIEPVTLSVSVPAEPSRTRGFFSPTRKLTRRTDTIELNVQPRPATGASWWLPASAVTLHGEWSGNAVDVEVDQPLTRTIILRAAGVMDSQLPDINVPAIEGASLYAEQPSRQTGANERGLVAEQTIKWALIPQREGSLVLPEVTIEWFNTVAGRFETATMPEEVIMVRPATGRGGSAMSPANQGEQAARKSESVEAEESANRTGSTEPVDSTALVGSGDSAGSTESAASDEAVGSVGSADLVGADDSAGPPGPMNVAVLDETDASPVVTATDEGAVGAIADTVTGSQADTTANTAPDSAASKAASMAVSTSTDSAAGTISPQTDLRTSVDVWRTLALTMLVLWMMSVTLYFRHRLKTRGSTGSGLPGAIRRRAGETYLVHAPLVAVEAACKRGDPVAVRDSLLEWAGRQWSIDTPRTLTALADRLPDGAARQTVKRLDASLYSRHGVDASESLATSLTSSLADLPGQLKAHYGKSSGFGTGTAIDRAGSDNVGEVDSSGQGDVRERGQGRGLPSL